MTDADDLPSLPPELDEALAPLRAAVKKLNLKCAVVVAPQAEPYYWTSSNAPDPTGFHLFLCRYLATAAPANVVVTDSADATPKEGS